MATTTYKITSFSTESTDSPTKIKVEPGMIGDSTPSEPFPFGFSAKIPKIESPAFGAPSAPALGAPSAPAFGAAPAFGSLFGTPAFGAPPAPAFGSLFGTPAFGAPVFGSPFSRAAETNSLTSFIADVNCKLDANLSKQMVAELRIIALKYNKRQTDNEYERNIRALRSNTDFFGFTGNKRSRV